MSLNHVSEIVGVPQITVLANIRGECDLTPICADSTKRAFNLPMLRTV